MEKTAREIYDQFRKGMMSKTDSWTTLISDEIKLIGPLAEIEGKEGFIEVNEPFFSSIIESEVHDVIECDNKIITRVSTKVKMPSGKEIVLKVCEWYEVNNNLITMLRVYFDTDEFRKEMGG